MAEVAPRPSLANSGSRAPSEASIQTVQPLPPPAAPIGKKGKAKKVNNDPNETQRQLAARIAQFEQDNAGRLEEDGEIDREVRKANREMQSMLSSMDNANSRADHVHKKWMDLFGELKRTERDHARAKKRADQLQKDKDTQRTELTKANAVKDKLEKLSREMTRENKRLKEELRDVKEIADDKNLELHGRLEQMMDDVELVVQSREDPDRFVGQMDEDSIFREKFKSMVEQYEMREIHVASVLRARELEIQYHIAQHDKLKKAQDAELTKSHQLTRQVSTFSQTENELRSQLNIYVEKFKQVEDTLNNSNDLFLTFRKEMEEMSKKTKRLEKENMHLTRKQEATNKNIFQMAEERSHSQAEIDKLKRENDKLVQLCRAMQLKGYGRAGGGDVTGGGGDQAVLPAGGGGSAQAQVDELVGTDSEYDEYDEDDEDDDFDDETEEDEPEPPPPRTFGPVPPPPPPPPAAVNAASSSAPPAKKANGVNGVRH